MKHHYICSYSVQESYAQVLDLVYIMCSSLCLIFLLNSQRQSNNLDLIQHLWIQVVVNDFCPSELDPLSIFLLIQKYCWITLGEVIEVFQLVTGDGELH